MRSMIKGFASCVLAFASPAALLAFESEIRQTGTGFVFDAAHGKGIVLNFEMTGLPLDELPIGWAKQLCDLMAPRVITQIRSSAPEQAPRFVGVEVVFTEAAGTWFEGFLIEDEACGEALPNLW